LIEHHFQPKDNRGAVPTHAKRNIVNAILYINETGAQWRMLPKELRAWKSVYDHYSNWNRGGALLKSGGRQRMDSTHVLAAVRKVNRLERVGETLRAAVNRLAVVVSEWLQRLALPCQCWVSRSRCGLPPSGWDEGRGAVTRRADGPSRAARRGCASDARA
jgi:transposase